MTRRLSSVSNINESVERELRGRGCLGSAQPINRESSEEVSDSGLCVDVDVDRARKSIAAFLQTGLSWDRPFREPGNLCSETHGFASPPHDGFAFIEGPGGVAVARGTFDSSA